MYSWILCVWRPSVGSHNKRGQWNSGIIVEHKHTHTISIRSCAAASINICLWPAKQLAHSLTRSVAFSLSWIAATPSIARVTHCKAFRFVCKLFLHNAAANVAAAAFAASPSLNPKQREEQQIFQILNSNFNYRPLGALHSACVFCRRLRLRLHLRFRRYYYCCCCCVCCHWFGG